LSSSYDLDYFIADLTQAHCGIAEYVVLVYALREDLTVDYLEDQWKTCLVEILLEPSSLFDKGLILHP
jgi:hypothetical protein